MKLNQEQKEVLIDTLKYYKDKKHKVGYNSKRGVCTYSGGSTGCAVGRLIPKKLRVQWDKEFNEQSIDSIFDICEEKLPKKLTSLGMDFLVDLQNLHDNPLLSYQTNLISWESVLVHTKHHFSITWKELREI